MPTTKEQTIINAILAKKPNLKIDQVTFYGLNGGWQAFVTFYDNECECWFDECILLGDEINQALANIENDNTNPPLSELGI